MTKTEFDASYNYSPDGELEDIVFNGHDINELLRYMIRTSGKSAAQISRELGKTSGYLSVLLADGRTPRTDLFIDIAKACGYSIGLWRDNNEAVIFADFYPVSGDGEATWHPLVVPDGGDPFVI